MDVIIDISEKEEKSKPNEIETITKEIIEHDQKFEYYVFKEIKAKFNNENLWKKFDSDPKLFETFSDDFHKLIQNMLSHIHTPNQTECDLFYQKYLSHWTNNFSFSSNNDLFFQYIHYYCLQFILNENKLYKRLILQYQQKDKKYIEQKEKNEKDHNIEKINQQLVETRLNEFSSQIIELKNLILHHQNKNEALENYIVQHVEFDNHERQVLKNENMFLSSSVDSYAKDHQKFHQQIEVLTVKNEQYKKLLQESKEHQQYYQTQIDELTYKKENYKKLAFETKDKAINLFNDHQDLKQKYEYSILRINKLKNEVGILRKYIEKLEQKTNLSDQFEML